MLRAKITSKGQITLPAVLRKRLNLQPGDELLFEIKPDGEIKISPLKHRRLTELYASLPAGRPYPGKEKIRQEVAASLAQQLLRKEN